jgi:iron-sulfur cluster repair protein YtfE (RIC family)
VPSAFGRAQGQHLIQVHRHLRRETAHLLSVIAEAASGGRTAESARAAVAGLTMRQNYRDLGSFCAGFCSLLSMHHMIEDDAVFPPLLSSDRTLGPVIDQLKAEHHVIAGILTRIDAALAALISGSGTANDLQGVADELATVLISHLNYEEAQLVPALSVYS